MAAKKAATKTKKKVARKPVHRRKQPPAQPQSVALSTDSNSTDERNLNTRQLVFVDYYLGAANFNGTRAAILAGYSEKTAYAIASENLKKPDIAAEIKRRLMDTTEIEARLNEHARGSLGDLLDDDGKFNLKEAKRTGKDRLLKELTVNVDKTTKRISYKYKIHDPQAALDKLARMHGKYLEKLEQSGEVTMRVIYGDDGSKETTDNTTA